jgi:DNA-binding FadR family transcriptional regulator
LEELRALVDQMRQRAATGGYFLDKDLAFHCAIYRTLGNRVLNKLLEVFCDIYRNLRDKSLLVTRDPIAEVNHHAEILQAIEARDVALAQRRIAEHFSGIKDRIRSAPIVNP